MPKDDSNEIANALIVSMAHIKKSTCDWLEAQETAENVHVAISPFCFVIFLGDKENIRDLVLTVPGELAALVKIAQELGAYLLVLDRDADTLNGYDDQVQTYYW